MPELAAPMNQPFDPASIFKKPAASRAEVPTDPLHASSAKGMTIDSNFNITRVGGGTYTGQTINKPVQSGTVTHARNAKGTGIATGADITGDSLVNIRGSEMKIKDALRVGLVVRRQDGAYEVPNDLSEVFSRATGRPVSDPLAPEGQPATANDGEPETPMESLGDDGIEGTITEVASNAEAVGEVQRLIYTASVGEQFDDNTLRVLAERMGWEVEQTKAKVAATRASFEQQALKSISGRTFDAQEVMDWGYENAPKLMKDAINAHAMERHTKGYEAVYTAYVEALEETSPGSLLNAEFGEGVKVTRNADGKLMFHSRQYGTVPWKFAVKRGWVNVGQR